MQARNFKQILLTQIKKYYFVDNPDPGKSSFLTNASTFFSGSGEYGRLKADAYCQEILRVGAQYVEKTVDLSLEDFSDHDRILAINQLIKDIQAPMGKGNLGHSKKFRSRLLAVLTSYFDITEKDIKSCMDEKKRATSIDRRESDTTNYSKNTRLNAIFTLIDQKQAQPANQPVIY